MPRDSECIVCNAGRPNLQAICTDCDGCMVEHCQCDPCQHGKTRAEECVFCQRGFALPLSDVMVMRDNVEDDINWLLGEQNV